VEVNPIFLTLLLALSGTATADSIALASEATMKPHRGTLILVFGILGLVLCLPFGIAAWIMGNGDLKQIDAGTMDPSGRSLTNAGKLIGMIATSLAVIGMVVGILLVVLGVFGGAVAHMR
jgi:hypothetical protein